MLKERRLNVSWAFIFAIVSLGLSTLATTVIQTVTATVIFQQIGGIAYESMYANYRRQSI